MNIFAEQLADILAKHHHELSNLFTWKLDIPPNTVLRLKASLTRDQSATLNTDQIDFLAEKYRFDEDDLRRLRAALLAEAVRKMIANRMSTSSAYKLGMVTLELLLSDDPNQVMHASDVLVSEMRDLPDLLTSADTVRGLAPDGAREFAEHHLEGAACALDGVPLFDSCLLIELDEAEEAYHQGLLWLEVARDTGDRRARAGYVAQAQAYLDRAAHIGQQCAEFAQGSSEQSDLLAHIQTAQNDAKGMI